jgi:S-adenosylmethionine synthetase
MIDNDNMREKYFGHRSYLFTSESVAEGHPDKIADQISDAVLDEALSQDPLSHVACETLVSHNLVVAAGEITTKAMLNIPEIVRRVISEVGYDEKKSGIDPARCIIVTEIRKQSEEIGQAVGDGKGPDKENPKKPDKNEEDSLNRKEGRDELGAGDQGLMFGYATDETPQLMPLPIMLAQRLVMKAAELRKTSRIPWLLPDGKSQVTVRYEDGRPVTVERVVLSLQHKDGIDKDELEETIKREIIEAVIPSELRSGSIQYFINPSGKFTSGGPAADTGLTGRKIIVDTYGGSCPHGGGCFSGKDPTKVDRSGAYAARYAAKNIVAAGLARRCTVQLSYAIGDPEPTSVMVDTHGTGNVNDSLIEKAVREIFPLKPGQIIKELKLRRPIYRKTAVYGHFGRELPEFTWERRDRIEALRQYFRV